MTAQILLVEDDRSIREITEIGLRAAGYKPLVAADGLAGLRLFEAAAPDVVVLDVMLPGMDGLALCRAIRESSATPIIMLTARTETADVVAGLEAGADDYLRKPFVMAELVARIGVALRRVTPATTPAAPDAPEDLALGPLRIDTAGYTVEREGRPIALSRTEFRLLVELARRPGTVFTRDILLDRVWGYDYLGDSRLVDVAIQRLRAKVEADPARPELILTVRGAGYKAAR